MRSKKRDEVSLFGIRCEECSCYLVRTASGFLSCPHGHGRLVEQQDEPPELDEASLFDPAELEAS